MGRLRVLIVDDDLEIRTALREALEDEGCDAVCRDGGAAALGFLRSPERKPDLILLDLMMPGMNGWEFRERLLRDPALAAIPVVVMTAARNLQGIVANEVLFKPVRIDDLVNVVQRHATANHDAP